VTIPNNAPDLSGTECLRLIECVRSGWISTSGPLVDEFQREVAAFHGVDVAIATASGTAAIHLALLAIGVGPGDLVLCPALTFIASVNPVRYCGASPILIAVERDTLGMDPGVLNDALRQRTTRRNGRLEWRDTGQRVAAVLVAHLYGRVADVTAIAEIAGRFGLPVIEDAAESFGARRNRRLAGTTGDIGCFSFNGNKMITCGSGGMVIAKSRSHLESCRHLSLQARRDAWTGVHDAIGYNYRMNNLSAAIGLAQLERVDTFLQAKRRIAARYRTLLSATPLEVPANLLEEEPSCWMVLARMATAIGDLPDRMRRLAERGIGVRPIWRPLADHSPYVAAPYIGGGHEGVYFNSILCLPSSVNLTNDEQCQVAAALESEFMK